MIIESWASLLFVVFSSLSLSFIVKHLRLPFPAKPTSKPPLPPAASPLPLLSHLLLRRGSLCEIELLLRRLHSNHGPIFTLRLFPGAPPAVFISDASLAHAALIRHGDTFADRPPAVEPIIFLTAGNHDISSSKYGPLWHLLRSNLSSEALHRLRLFSLTRRLIIQLLLDKLRSNSGCRFIAKESFQYAVLSIHLLMCFGEKLGESSTREIQSLQAFLLSLFTTLNVFAFFPAVTKLLFHRKWEKIVTARRRQAEIFLPLIRARQERKQSMKGGGNDGCLIEHCYVDSLLNFQLPVEGGRGLTDDEMVNLCHEFLSGAATTTTAIEWTMAEVVKHRGVQRKLSEEIESAMVREAEEGQITEEDLQRMPYLKAVVMEALRRHPPSHFVLPHSVTEEVVLDGFLIPKGAEVHFSVTDVNWDRRRWEEPMEFKPERFMAGGEGEGMDITGSREMRMLTFGAGRRMCPGYGLAMLHLELLVANLVREFEWKPAAGEEVDLSEKLNFTTVMNNPLTVQILPRWRVEKRDASIQSNAGPSSAAQLHEEDDQEQKWKIQPSIFSNEVQNITSLYRGDNQSIASIDPQELEFLRRFILEQDKRILKLEEEVQILKAQREPRLPSSVGNDWMGYEQASSSQQQSEQHNSHVSIPHNLHVQGEHGAATISSAGNGSIEKEAKKTINRQSSAGRPQASSSVRRKLKDPNAYSPSMASAGGKLLASRSVKIKIQNPPRKSKGVVELNDAQVSNVEGEEAAVDMISSSGITSIEREVKKRVERQTSDNRLLSPSLRTRQRELAFSQSGIGVGNKLLGSRSMKPLNRGTKII